MSRIFIFAGEHSGDLHGEQLISSLLATDPTLFLYGIGGPHMRSTPFQCLLPMEAFQVMGFVDVLSSLPKLISLFYRVKKLILSSKPDAVIFIDYPGFNLRMAKSLKRCCPLFHYISPTVWAWGKKRLKIMENTLDHLYCILPFEASFFKHSSLKTTYVGHPLVHRIASYTYNPLFPQKKYLSLFPGSRLKEIQKNLPLQLQVARKIASQHSLELVISLADPSLQSLISSLAPSIKLIPSSQRYELMQHTFLAIATSGTVALELALHSVPTVVTFAISPIDCFLAQKIFKIDLPFYALPNLIANKEIFPELFGPHFTTSRLENALLDLLIEKNRQHCLQKIADLKQVIGPQHASEETARSILKCLKSR